METVVKSALSTKIITDLSSKSVLNIPRTGTRRLTICDASFPVRPKRLSLEIKLSCKVSTVRSLNATVGSLRTERSFLKSLDIKTARPWLSMSLTLSADSPLPRFLVCNVRRSEITALLRPLWIRSRVTFLTPITTITGRAMEENRLAFTRETEWTVRVGSVVSLSVLRVSYPPLPRATAWISKETTEKVGVKSASLMQVTT